MTIGRQTAATRQMKEGGDQFSGIGQIYIGTSRSSVSQSNSKDRSHLFISPNVLVAYRNDRTGAMDMKSGKAHG
jgi:hypothetical protein